MSTVLHPARAVSAAEPPAPGHPATPSFLAFPEARSFWVGLAALFGILAAMYASNIRHFVYMWSSDDNYTHGFLVPLLSLYFAREASRKGPIAHRGGEALGMALLSLSVLIRLATTVVPVGMAGDLGFVLGLAGAVAMMAGRAALRRYGFALAFLVFMIPLPVALYTTLASPLQLIVSRLGSSLLNALGIPVLCEGNLMELPGGTRMFVAEACSGMRQLTGFLALTTAVAYLSNRPAWYRGAVVASSIPIAMSANILRVTMTGLIMFYADPKYASGSFHTLEGLLMMAVGLGLLGLFCSLLNVVAGAPTTGANTETAA